MQALNKNQKISLIILSIFTIFFIVLWVLQLKRNLQQPFSDKSSTQTKQNQYAEQENRQEDLRLKDTDGDGLSDWDEIYVYKTSPYLEDSDSDGYDDGEEIRNNKDPNCPLGQNCSAEILNEDANYNNNHANFEKPQNDTSLKQTTQESNEVVDDKYQGVLKGDTSPEVLRELLLQSGIDKNLLDKVSDEELMKMYQETLNN